MGMVLFSFKLRASSLVLVVSEVDVLLCCYCHIYSQSGVRLCLQVLHIVYI